MSIAMIHGLHQRVFSARFKPKNEDFNTLLVVYEAEKGQWRGFAHPYGETIEASTKSKALKTIRDLTTGYYNTIKKYDSPDHLINGGLNNLMDKKVFNWVLGNKKFMDKIHSKSATADSKYCYVETFKPQA